MELDLKRIDYTEVGITHVNCMKLLPPDDNRKQQKVAIGDTDGVLQVFSIKPDGIQIHFKTLPGPEIHCLELNSSQGVVRDKIFAAVENEVKGYNKKGKLFLNFDSNMTEPINSMYILGSDLFLCGKHVYNHYKDGSDVGSYLCGDNILDVVAILHETTGRLTSVLACEGRMLRLLEHSRVIHSISLDCIPTVLHTITEEENNFILFGTEDGRIGVIDIEKSYNHYRWLVSHGTEAKITCLESYSFSQNETQNVIVGFDDGTIIIYSFRLNDVVEPPIAIFSYNCEESITAIQGGIVGSNDFEEILVCTYTGRLFGLTTQVADHASFNETIDSLSFSKDIQGKINKMKTEVEELETRIAKEREKYQITTQLMSNTVSAIPLLAIKDSFTLNTKEVAYNLTLEAPTAIDHVLLQSNVSIDLMDVEKNSAIVSFSEPDPQNQNYLLATYRCQANTNRLEIKIKTAEGQYGHLQAYVTPAVQPKCSQLRRFEIRPLSLHTRIHSFTENRPLNVLVLKGAFSLAEIHSWIYHCFPEVPEKPQLTEKCHLIFQSCFVGTIVLASYFKGEAEFKSDNISSLAVLKEYLTRQATRKKVKIEVSFSVNENTIEHVLSLVNCQLVHYKELSKNIQIIKALEELDLNEETTEHLIPKYKLLLEKKKNLEKEFCLKPAYLERIYGMIAELYIDFNKFKGINVKPKVYNLLKVIDTSSYEELIKCFLSKAEDTTVSDS